MRGQRGRAVRATSVATAVVVALAVALVGTLAAPAAAQDTGWEVVDFDAYLEVAPDGTVRVLEEIVVDFGPLQRHGIFRRLPVRYRYDDTHDRVIEVDDVVVRGGPGTPDDLDVSREGGDLVLRIGDPDRTISGRQSYTIGYRVRGALNTFDSHDELYWNVTGADWPVPIRAASATVAGVPIAQTACFAGYTGGTDLCQRAELVTAQQAEFAAEELSPGEGMTVVVGFPKGAVATSGPILQERWSLGRAFQVTPWTVAGALLVALLAAYAIARLAWKQGRDEEVRSTITGSDPPRRGLFAPAEGGVEYRPPDGLRPAELGVLVDERVDSHDIAATIVDLAVRGHLTIEEIPKSGWFSRTDWCLRRREGADDGELRPWERRLLDGLFEDGDEVLVSDLKGEFHTDYRAVQDLLYDTTTARGWFRGRPDRTRLLWLGLGIAFDMVAVGIVVVAAVFTTFALVAVPLVPAATALIVLHRWMPRRTGAGSAALQRTLGFRRFIETAETRRMEFAEQQGTFVEYLPYAVAFQAVDRWARAFEGLDAAAATMSSAGVWYHGSGPFDLPAFAGSLSDFGSVAGGALAQTPASSGSSGFGGGGFSGGGVGGGGGGSW